jgi:hypothetical protein
MVRRPGATLDNVLSDFDHIDVAGGKALRVRRIMCLFDECVNPEKVGIVDIAFKFTNIV